MSESVDLFRTLTTQHREVDAMLAMLAESKDVEQREALLPVLKQQLLAHAKAEEQTFYPALARAGEKGEAKHAEREHEDIEAALEDLEGLELEDEGWEAALKTLTEAVQHHVQEEEGEVFAAARAALDEDALETIAEEFRERRREQLEALGGEDDHYDQLTKGELLEEARDLDVPGRSSMSKEQLIASLRAEH